MLAMTLDFPHDFPVLSHVCEREHFAAAFDLEGLSGLFPLVCLPVKVRIHYFLVLMGTVPQMQVAPFVLLVMMRPVEELVTYSFLIFLLTMILHGPCE